MRERRPWGDAAVSDIVGTMLMVAVVVLLGSSVAIVVSSTISNTTVPAAGVQMGALRAGDGVVSVVLSDGDPIPLDTLGIRIERNGSAPATIARASWTTPDPTSWRAGDRLSFPVSPVVAPEEEIRVRVLRGDASSQIATVTARVGGTTSLSGTATLTAAISPSTVLADGVAPVLVTVRVSHPAGAGAVSGVVADLEDLTGAEADTLALNDAGLDGDVQGGDGVWSTLVRAPASTTLGPHTIELSAIDLAGATTGTASVTLTVSQSLVAMMVNVSRVIFDDVPSSLASGSTTTLTLRLQDNLGVTVFAPRPIVVALGTNSTIGYFLSGGSIVSSVTIPTSASSTTVQYVDYRSGGLSQLGAFAEGIVPASAAIPVTGRSGKGIPDHLEFTSVPSSLASRTTSSTLTLTLRDSNNETVRPPSTLTILLVSNTLGSSFVDATTGATIQTINMSTSESSVSFKYYDAGYQSLSTITAFANDTIPAFAQIPISGYGTLPITFYGTCSGCTVTGGSILFEGDRLAVPTSAATTSFRLKNWTYDRADPSRVLDDSMAGRIVSETWGWTMYFQFGISGTGTSAVPGIKSIALWNKNVTTTYEATAGQVSLVGLDLDMTSSASIQSAGFTCKTTSITGLGVTATADGCTNAVVYRNADIRASPTFLLSWMRDESNNNNGPTKTGMFGVDVVVSS